MAADFQTFTDETVSQRPRSGSKKKPDRPRIQPVKDILTITLEELSGTDQWYYSDKQFDHFVEPNVVRNGVILADGHRFIFDRFYPNCNVLMDLITIDTPQQRAKIELKLSALRSFNRKCVSTDRYGYLPLVAFHKVQRSSFDQLVKRRTVFSLPQPIPQAQLSREIGIVKSWL